MLDSGGHQVRLRSHSFEPSFPTARREVLVASAFRFLSLAEQLWFSLTPLAYHTRKAKELLTELCLFTGDRISAVVSCRVHAELKEVSPLGVPYLVCVPLWAGFVVQWNRAPKKRIRRASQNPSPSKLLNIIKPKEEHP